MGGGHSYSADSTRQLLATARSTGRSYMVHNDNARRTGRYTVHPAMDVKRRNRFDEVVRESLDLPDLPHSVPVVVLFDTTGSMASWPEQFVTVLGDLMDQLRADNVVENPHILFGAINDFNAGARIPSQIGQFERTNEINNTITNIILEGGGGNGDYESHQLAMYFLARRSRLACLTRGKKGHLFIASDEPPYSTLTRTEAERVFGDEIPRDVPTTELVAALKELYHVTWIWPNGTHNGGNSSARREVTDLVGEESLVRIDRPDELTRVIVDRVIQTERAHRDDASPIVPVGISGIASISQTPNVGASPALQPTQPAPTGSDPGLPTRPLAT